jgi:Ca2+/Na+ antiporter
MPLRLKKNTVWREIPYLLLSAVALLVLCNDVYFSGASANVLSRGDGIILLLFFTIFMVYVFLISKVNAEHYEEVKPLSNGRIAIYLIVGIGGLFFGGKLAVDNASALARQIGASDRLIAVTVIAFGTSLPELVTSVIAARKGETEVAFGNVVGSNIYNLLGIGGATMLFAPGPIPADLLPVDLGLVATSAAIILGFTLLRGVSRIPALALLAGYAAYLAYLVSNA